MSVEENKAVVRSMIRSGIVGGDLDAAFTAYAPDVEYHAPLMDQAPRGTHPLALMRQAITMTREAFPDLHYDIEALIAEDDQVAVLYRWDGTHQGHFGGLAPTGRHVTATGAIVCRLADGLIVEQWDVDDRLEVMQQLGLLPGPPVAP